MGEEEQQGTGRLMRTPKEGERILGPTRRPDGTLRKPIRIRAGYVPQDEVAIYQSKGVLLRKAQPEVPPGYDPGTADGTGSKPKTKSAKRNERKKEKKLQAALAASDDKGKDVDLEQAEKLKTEESLIDETQHRLEHVATVMDQISNLSLSSTSEMASPSVDQIDNSGQDIDKRIRALKKKIRLSEGQCKGGQQNMKPEQLEKMAKVEGWREELQGLEDKKANLVS